MSLGKTNLGVDHIFMELDLGFLDSDGMALYWKWKIRRGWEGRGPKGEIDDGSGTFKRVAINIAQGEMEQLLERSIEIPGERKKDMGWIDVVENATREEDSRERSHKGEEFLRDGKDPAD